jgi:zinc transport system ATP-binding protein
MENIIQHPARQICLRFEDVSFAYTRSDGEGGVLRNVAFHIHRGEFVALVGPNGSGKTTILKLILGLERPESGSIELFGTTCAIGRSRVGYVPQQASFDRAFPICVQDVVKMGRLHPLSRKYSDEDRAAVEDALKQVEISDLAKRPYAALSGGERRRVLVARALAAKPSLLALDEPTANMDTESEKRLYDTLGKLKGNTTVLIVTHDREFVSSLIDRVLCMGEGGLVQHQIEGDAKTHGARILHNASIPGNDCVK